MFSILYLNNKYNRRYEKLRHKKLIIGTGICLLGIALSAAWFIPCKLEATYAGKTPYQYDAVSAKSFHANTVSLLGRKNPVTDISISPKKLLKPIISHGVMRMDRSTKEILSTRKTYLRSLFMRIIPKRNWPYPILNSQRLLKF